MNQTLVQALVNEFIFGKRSQIITGQQGTGMTAMLKSQSLNPEFKQRIAELTQELDLTN